MIVEGYYQNCNFLSKSLAFLNIRKPSCLNTTDVITKIVIKDSSLIQSVKRLKQESYLTLRCKCSANSRDPSTTDLLLQEILFVKEILKEPPFTLNKPLDMDHICSDNINNFVLKRTPYYHRLQRIRTFTYGYIYDYFMNKGAFVVDAPHIIQEPSENGSEVFEVDYPLESRKLYLAQSPQLYKQYMINSGLNSVFELGHIYRAEKFNTTKHMCETVCLDYETITSSVYDLTKTLEDFLVGLSCYLHSKEVSLKVLSPKDFTRITYQRALELLKVSQLDSSSEKRLPDIVGTPFVFITNYPNHIRPFYTKEDSGFDLICSFCELSSGSLRVNSIKQLQTRIPKSLLGTFYHQSFKYSSPDHGGWGLGLDRFLTYYLELSNIRRSKFHKNF